MLEIQELESLLHLKGIGNKELEQLAHVIDKDHYSKGEVIFQEKQPIDSFYLVEHGEIELGKIEPPDEEVPHPSTTLGVGSYLGNLSLLTDARCSNTAMAVDDCDLLVFDKDGFKSLSKRIPSCILKISKDITVYLCQLLRRIDEKYVDMVDIMIDGVDYATRNQHVKGEEIPKLAQAKDRKPILASEVELVNIPLFADFTPHERKQVARIMTGCTYQEGEHIFLENRGEQELYVICDGMVKLTKKVQKEKTVTLGLLGNGKFFGVFSLLEDNKGHFATAQTLKDSYILTMEKSAFKELLWQNPSCGLKMMNRFRQEMCNLLRKIEYDFSFISKILYEAGPFYM